MSATFEVRQGYECRYSDHIATDELFEVYSEVMRGRTAHPAVS